MRVDFDEPALAVFAPDKTRLLFPLARVSRVIVTGVVDWSMRALFACADAGIAVVFIAESGEIRCRWLGRVQQKQGFLQLYSELLERNDAVQHYQDWFAGMQRMAVRSTARRLGLSDWQLADAESLNKLLLKTVPNEGVFTRNILQGFILSAVLQYLSDLGLDTGDFIVAGGKIQLADDLTAILLWDYYPVLVSWHKKSEIKREMAAWAGLFEQRRQRTEHLLRGLMNRLHQCLRAAG